MRGEVAKLLKRMARPERLELPTLWFEARCSIQLSYGRVACVPAHCFRARCSNILTLTAAFFLEAEALLRAIFLSAVPALPHTHLFSHGRFDLCPPLALMARSAVLDFAERTCRKKISAEIADRWNFGLRATIPREPRQGRKAATVTGQLRVPRRTRSSSHRRLCQRELLKNSSHEL